MAECYVQLLGGLGNQLFQIAVAYAHCKRSNRQLKISSDTHGGRDTFWDTYTHNFRNMIGRPASASASSPRRFVRNGSMWREPCFAYTPIPAGANAIVGYFQSSKYFADYADEIRSLFVPPPTVQEAVANKYAGFLANSSDYAVVHIRRGDYYHGNNANFHGVAKEVYFERAIAKMLEMNPSVKFLVFSDDLPWCRGLACLTDATFVDEPDPTLALCLMSKFEYYVLSNSSFSWWAAWLETPAKTVIVPDKWFGPIGPQDYHDIYEPSWIKVSVA
jgi:hypothetical protein